MGEAPGFKLFKLFNSRAQLNNLNPGGGPRGGVRDPPAELNNLNPGGSPVFKLFNSRPRASPPDPLPQDLNYLNYLNYLIPGPN